jgi:NAD(P)-dependent dehydrogenase (short-subunit alcohol dehydrogenase family)
MAQRTWLITGASAGLGFALVEAVLRHGDRVIATARDTARLAPLAGDDLLALTLDVTSPDDISAVVGRAAAFAPVDVVVNNAGYGFIGGVEESSDAEIRRQMEVNFFGAVAVTRAFLPQMRERRSGFIVNVSSAAGIVVSAGGGFYSCSKFALEAFSEALAQEGRDLGIGVLIVEPGGLRTDFAGRSAILPARRIPDYAAIDRTLEYMRASDGQQQGDPDKAAALIVETVGASDRPARLILGADCHHVVEMILDRRLQEVRAQREQAASIMFDDLETVIDLPV